MKSMAWILPLPLLFASGCSLRATTDQILDTTSNVTGTTSSARSWFSEDGQLKPDFKTAAFVAINEQNLRHDMAAGQGEYLTSLGVLMGVPDDRRSAFFTAAQAGYTTTSDLSDAKGLFALLRQTAMPFIH